VLFFALVQKGRSLPWAASADQRRGRVKWRGDLARDIRIVTNAVRHMAIVYQSKPVQSGIPSIEGPAGAAMRWRHKRDGMRETLS